MEILTHYILPNVALFDRVTFKPQTIIPDIDFRWDLDDLTTNHSEANQ